MTAPAGSASPLDDIAAWRAQRPDGLGAGGLTPDLVALAQSGVNVALATVDDDGRPIVGAGIACLVLADGVLRILASRAANRRLVAAIEAGGPVAATFTGAPSHRAFQVKAGGARVLAAADDDTPEIDRQTALSRDGLIEIGFSPELAAGFVAHEAGELVAIEIVPERVFTQTPGPGAGTELTR